MAKPTPVEERHAAGSTDGQRPALLMCAPSLYNVDYVINPWMQGNVGACSQTRAMAQWHGLHNLLSRLAQVQLIEPVAGSPDMVFTANAGLVRQNTFVLSRFRHAERQGEEAWFRRWFADAGYRVTLLEDNIPFEGEGDALFSAAGERLWVGHGHRTSLRSLARLRQLWPDVDVVSLALVDPRFYHLDTCFAPLEDGSLLWFPEAFAAESRARVEQVYAPAQRIAVAEADAVRFACNVVNLGRTLVLNQISAALESELTGRGFDVWQTPLDEFLKAGGAAKCLVLHLSPELHAPWFLLAQRSQETHRTA